MLNKESYKKKSTTVVLCAYIYTFLFTSIINLIHSDYVLSQNTTIIQVILNEIDVIQVVIRKT